MAGKEVFFVPAEEGQEEKVEEVEAFVEGHGVMGVAVGAGD